jgi:hypothetical protein
MNLGSTRVTGQDKSVSCCTAQEDVPMDAADVQKRILQVYGIVWSLA